MSQITSNPVEHQNLSLKEILKTWLPLAGSWLLMSIELPAINAVIARLANPEINLAAYGGVAFSIALTIEAPVIMLLAASTALSRDWQSYQKLRKFTLILGGGLSALHFIVAVTPIYDFIVNVLLQVPPEVVEPARIGMICLSPWSLGIAFRRFQQGAMIRFGHSRIVGEVTLVRLLTVIVVLTTGMILKTIPGTLLAGLAQGLGVTLEATYAGLRVRKIIPEMKAAPPTEKPLTLKRFVRFYFPLALTSSLWLLWQPVISGAVSRMPDPLESLAVWSVVTGVLFVFRSGGVAYNEAVVALLEETNSFPALRRFARIMSGIISVIVIAFVVSPLSHFWFASIANLTPDKAQIARITIALGIPLGLLSMYISFFQGIVVNQERTGVVAEAVGMFLLGLFVVLVIGIITEAYKGVYVASAAFTMAHLTQVIWLLWRSRKQRRLLSSEAY
jgi:hypothetical protein